MEPYSGVEHRISTAVGTCLLFIADCLLAPKNRHKYRSFSVRGFNFYHHLFYDPISAACDIGTRRFGGKKQGKTSGRHEKTVTIARLKSNISSLVTRPVYRKGTSWNLRHRFFSGNHVLQLNELFVRFKSGFVVVLCGRFGDNSVHGGAVNGMPAGGEGF